MEYDVIVVGSGPNGLAAAIVMQQHGLRTLIIEKNNTVGGGLRSGELTLPGYTHDICSAVHPMAVSSPFLKTLPLHHHGLNYIYPAICAAHPLDNGDAAVLEKSITDTAQGLDQDADYYHQLIQPLTNSWPSIARDVLGPPVHIPRELIKYARFGLQAIKAADTISKGFRTSKGKALWAGMAAHSMLPFSKLSSAAIALVLSAVGHVHGWPIVEGGSQKLADAMASYFKSIGGKIQTNVFIKSLTQLPPAKAILMDVSAKQLLAMAGDKMSSIYHWQLKRYRPGMGVFKIDFALNGAIPFTSEACRRAGTVHLGGSYEEIASSEHLVWNNKHSNNPFVLLAQQSIFDRTRVPENKNTAWAYCHVPNGSRQNMTTQIEKQIERFAPGFKDIIIAKHISTPTDLEAYNPNYTGGDINGGSNDISQLIARPALGLSSYRTSVKGLYICSASTPPGGGVHGMCGYYAAVRALKDVFNMTPRAID